MPSRTAYSGVVPEPTGNRPVTKTRCHECGKRAETWIEVYISDFDKAPVCLPCAQLMGWLPEGALSPAQVRE